MNNPKNRFLSLALVIALLVSFIGTSGSASVTLSSVQSSASDTWLVMLYQNGDDEVIEEDTLYDFNEAELVGSSKQVTIVSQLDRYDWGSDGTGEWTGTKRFLITKDSDLYTINSKELADLGEMDMGNPKTLIDFATWAIKAYPADHYVLMLGDHGAGWSGGWYDDSPNEGSFFKMQDIDDALGTIIKKTGIGQFELVAFDACLMGQLEVMSAIAPHAKFAVASEELEPAIGLAYASWLGAISKNPGMTGKDLGKVMVDTYIRQDIRITDADARYIYNEGEGSAKSVTDETIVDVTMSAIDLAEVKNLNSALNSLALALKDVNQTAVSQARTYAQSYASVFEENVPNSYIDLGSFVDLLLENIDDEAVVKAAKQVKAQLKKTVTSEMHGDNMAGSSGLSIFFPTSLLYKNSFAKNSDYRYSEYVGRFAKASLWDDFLTYHYTDQSFKAADADVSVLNSASSSQSNFSQAVADAAPAVGADIAAPGEGEITIKPIKVSAKEIGPDASITLSTTVTGSNVAYIYYNVSYWDAEYESYLTADMGFISADTTKKINGVYFPDWGTGMTIPIKYTWEPTLYYMSDGNSDHDQFAYFEPETYGVDESHSTYIVHGTYTFEDTGSQTDAVIRFNGDGEMQTVFSFNEEGSAHEISPKKGDTFTIQEQWLEYTDANPDGVYNTYDGGTMTFGKNGLSMVAYYAYSGDYTVGINVEDMNGNLIEDYVEVTVTE